MSNSASQLWFSFYVSALSSGHVFEFSDVFSHVRVSVSDSLQYSQYFDPLRGIFYGGFYRLVSLLKGSLIPCFFY